MSTLGGTEQPEDLEFRWGKMRGRGGKRKEIQFYESFTYDGEEYALYDCIYMYKEGEPEPYIAKLIKIWDAAEKSKKIKVQWFFRPSEIRFHLGDTEIMENEIFFASGEGVGLANVNPLEAIAGKCNVVCISKDSRNPQPSEGELQMADFVFYRTFDVGTYVISDAMKDLVGGLEVKFIFNRNNGRKATDVPKPGFEKNEGCGNAVACQEIQGSPGENQPEDCKKVNADENHNDLAAVEDVPVRNSLAKPCSLSEGAKDSIIQVASTSGRKLAPGIEVDSGDVAAIATEGCSVPGKVSSIKGDADNIKDKDQKSLVRQVSARDRGKSSIGSGALDDRLAKKAKFDTSVNLLEDKGINSLRESSVPDSNKQIPAISVPSEGKLKIGRGIDSVSLGKDGKFAEKSVATENRPSKKAKLENCANSTEYKNLTVASKMDPKSRAKDQKDSPSNVAFVGDSTKSIVNKSSIGTAKVHKGKNIEKTSKPSNGSLSKTLGLPVDKDRRNEGKSFEVTRRPNPDASKWFRELPWEERMKSAYERGTLVLLQNLDPEYTSGEVEDIVWHAFKENCTARMVQHTAVSSPHSGQAFVIFKSREAAEKVIKLLEDRCLIVSSQRPLIGCIATLPKSREKQSNFPGHLCIDKIKLQMQKEMKEAISTSHCSQPNTIEYEMAMEWCLLQTRSESWWNNLYQRQDVELTKLMGYLKS